MPDPDLVYRERIALRPLFPQARFPHWPLSLLPAFLTAPTCPQVGRCPPGQSGHRFPPTLYSPLCRPSKPLVLSWQVFASTPLRPFSSDQGPNAPICARQPSVVPRAQQQTCQSDAMRTCERRAMRCRRRRPYGAPLGNGRAFSHGIRGFCGLPTRTGAMRRVIDWPA